jgi:hypothetical protein
LGRPQSWYGRFGEEKILEPTGTRTPKERKKETAPPKVTNLLCLFYILAIKNNSFKT